MLPPGIDIKLSNNFERTLWLARDGDGAAVASCQRALTDQGPYGLERDVLQRPRERFAAVRCGEKKARDELRRSWHETGAMLSRYTTPAAYAARRVDLEGLVVVVATAPPARLPRPIERATRQARELPVALAFVMQVPERYRNCATDATVLGARLPAEIVE